MYAAQQIVDQLSDRFSFSVITSDRDADGTRLRIDSERLDGKVKYVSDALTLIATVWSILRRANTDLIVLNSFFSFQFSILPLLLARTLFPTVPILMIPRGELFQAALDQKGWKKRLFLQAAHLSRLYQSLAWQVTDARESNAVSAQFPLSAPVVASELFPDVGATKLPITGIRKKAGSLRIVYLSRITPKKNLLFVLETLLECHEQDIELAIYGPLEDRQYWTRCRQLMNRFTGRPRASYLGAVPAGQAIKTFGEHHLFFFPTLSENFGYVILECIHAGRPILISNMTPFKNLASEGIGEDYSLADRAAFLASLKRYVAMDQEQYDSVLHSVEKKRQEFVEAAASHRGHQAGVFDQLCRGS